MRNKKNTSINDASVAKARLEKSENANFLDGINLSDLIDTLPHAIIIVGKDNNIRFANLAAQAFFSSGMSVLYSRDLRYFYPDDCPLVSLVEIIRSHGKSVNEYQMELSSPRMERVDIVDIYGAPLAESEENIILMIQTRNMAQKIERQIAHQGVARSVSGMANILAHEIKNPLSGIRGAAQLLEANLEEEDKALTRLVCAETDRICKLVDEMEEFSDPRVEQYQDVNIHKVLEHVRQISENGCAAHVRIIEEYDPSLPVIQGDYDKLVQAFLNLVKNAAESIPEDRKNGVIVLKSAYRPGIRLTVSGSGSRVSLPIEIQVQDNGSGILDEVKRHLFDPFITSKSDGKGLGLALLAKIVADHGGTIEFDSQAGKTVFRIFLPVKS